MNAGSVSEKYIRNKFADEVGVEHRADEHEFELLRKWTKEEIAEKMATDDQWLVRGLIAIYNHQTRFEQSHDRTIEDNGVGFNGVDAEILSSFARQVYLHRTLSEKQITIARKKMRKYAGQLTRIANKEL